MSKGRLYGDSRMSCSIHAEYTDGCTDCRISDDIDKALYGDGL